MIDGGSPARGPFQEVVELCLQLPVLDISAVGPVVDGLAQETHAGVDEAGRAVARAVVLVIELEAEEKEEEGKNNHFFTADLDQLKVDESPLQMKLLAN